MIGFAAVATASSRSGHPTWHFAVVAAGALVAFAVIQIAELRARRSQRVVTSRPVNLATGALWFVGAASAGAAAVHAVLCPAHFREATVFGLFFLAAAALQGAWAVRILTRPSPRLLLAGAIGNALIITVWIVSRTSGLPIGPDAWHPEGISAADAIATTLEVGIAAVSAALYLPRRPSAHAPVR